MKGVGMEICRECDDEGTQTDVFCLPHSGNFAKGQNLVFDVTNLKSLIFKCMDGIQRLAEIKI
jgi:hypothetical protein